MYVVISEEAKKNWQIKNAVSLKELEDAIRAFALSHGDEISDERIAHSISIYIEHKIIALEKKKND